MTMLHETRWTEKYGEWAFVAGSSEGLGAAFATEAAKRGFNIVLLARREHLLKQVAARLTADYGVEVRWIVADLAEVDSWPKIFSVLDAIDLGLFIYNAAAEPQGVFTDISFAEHQRNIVVNCTTPTALTHHISQSMILRGRGAIVLVGSRAGEQGIARFVSYGAAKSYEILLGEGLWYELGEHGIEAFTYVVGATATPKFLARMKDFINSQGESRLDSEDGESGRNLNSPKTPEQVAERLFASFGSGPRAYSHESDEQNVMDNIGKSRAQIVSEISDVMVKAYTSLAED